MNRLTQARPSHQSWSCGFPPLYVPILEGLPPHPPSCTRSLNVGLTPFSSERFSDCARFELHPPCVSSWKPLCLFSVAVRFLLSFKCAAVSDVCSAHLLRRWPPLCWYPFLPIRFPLPVSQVTGDPVRLRIAWTLVSIHFALWNGWKAAKEGTPAAPQTQLTCFLFPFSLTLD